MAESMVLLLFDVIISDDVEDAVVVVEEGGVAPRPIFDHTIRSHCIKLFHGCRERFLTEFVNFFHFIFTLTDDELIVLLSSSLTTSTGSLLTLPSLFSPDKPCFIHGTYITKKESEYDVSKEIREEISEETNDTIAAAAPAAFESTSHRALDTAAALASSAAPVGNKRDMIDCNSTTWTNGNSSTTAALAAAHNPVMKRASE